MESRGSNLWVVSDFVGQPARLAEFLDQSKIPGARAVVCGFDSVGIHVESLAVSEPALHASLSGYNPSLSVGEITLHKVQVDFRQGLDLQSVCAHLNLSPPEFVKRFCGAEYEVVTLGFSPGFPYLSGLPDSLCGLDRLPVARPRVPKGSIAITGNQACIYPSSTAGGWNLIGVTPMLITDLDRRFFAFSAGDRIQFIEVAP